MVMVAMVSVAPALRGLMTAGERPAAAAGEQQATDDPEGTAAFDRAPDSSAFNARMARLQHAPDAAELQRQRARMTLTREQMTPPGR